MKPKIHPIESQVLEKTQHHIFNNSRLACGIKLKPWMNEMIVTQIRHPDKTEHIKNYNQTEKAMFGL